MWEIYLCVFLSCVHLDCFWVRGRSGPGIWTQDFTLAKQVLYRLSPISSPFCSGYFGGEGLLNYLPWLALNCYPPNLSLPSEPWCCEPWVPRCIWIFKSMFSSNLPGVYCARCGHVWPDWANLITTPFVKILTEKRKQPRPWEQAWHSKPWVSCWPQRAPQNPRIRQGHSVTTMEHDQSHSITCLNTDKMKNISQAKEWQTPLSQLIGTTTVSSVTAVTSL
jgi:hypothetical protein